MRNNTQPTSEIETDKTSDKPCMIHAPKQVRLNLARALFEQAFEHCQDLGVEVKVKWSKGFVPFVPGRLWFGALLYAFCFLLSAFAADIAFTITPNAANPAGTTHLVFGHTNNLAATNLSAALYKFDLGSNLTAKYTFTNSGPLYFRAVAVTPDGTISLSSGEATNLFAWPPGLTLQTVNTLSFTNTIKIGP